MNSASGIGSLHKLACLYGIQTAYYNVAHRRCQATVDSLLAVLRSLGANVATLTDATPALRQRCQELWQRLIEPVTVVWHGNPFLIEVRLPASMADSLLVGHLTLEDGGQRDYQWRGADLAVTSGVEIEGIQYVVKRLLLPDTLPWGYHRFTLQIKGMSAETLIIVAPIKSYTPSEASGDRKWGVFLPLYALSTGTGWESGSYSSLETLTEWVAGLGGQVVATLPLLAAFLEQPFEPSPYAPVSRRLWNEFYLDIARIPEMSECLSARALLSSSSFEAEVNNLRQSSHVNYQREMFLKRKVLEELCQSLFAQPSVRLEALNRFAGANPLVEEYARFRATLEKKHTPWRAWPQRLREGTIREDDYREKDRRYHLYVQWLAQQQVEALSQRARDKGVALYLDLPLGVHPDGYDTWREQSLFALDVSVGAPPDAVFTSGQDWIFPPPHPDKIREQGYGDTIAYLRHHLRHAGVLRIDHVMGFHRLYWIPKGLPPGQGVYVRYRPQEFYAILALESCRHSSIIVGEDLGTVPREVRPAMACHGLHRMYVMHYELQANQQKALNPVSKNCVASLNNHDMPPFAAFWQGLDIVEMLELGLTNKASARREQKNRGNTQKALVNSLEDKGLIMEHTRDVYSILKAGMSFLSTSKARVVLANLEDLWLETQPQNIPGSGEKYPSWRRKARYSFEEFCQMPQVLDILREVERLRKTVEAKSAIGGRVQE